MALRRQGKSSLSLACLAMAVLITAFMGCGGAGDDDGGIAGNGTTTGIVTYDGNGEEDGEVPVDSTSYEEGQTVTVLGNSGNLTRAGYAYAGWNTRADGSGTTYTQGQTFSMGAVDVTLYARWTPDTPYITWNRIYSGDGGGGEGYSAQQTSDGGYIIAGAAYLAGVPGSHIMLIKVDENGDEVWNSILSISDSDTVRRVRQTSDGGYVLAGNAYSIAVGATDAWILKTDGNGSMLWSHTFDGGNQNGDAIYDVRETSDGGYVLAGCTNSYRAYAWQRDGLLIKTDANGVEVWHQLYGGDTGSGYLYAIEQTPDGGFILAGSTDPDGESSLEAWLIKTDENGDASDGHGWRKIYGDAENEEATCVRRTADGGYILSGWTASFQAVGEVCGFMIKTDGGGNLDTSFGTNGLVLFGGPTVRTEIQSIEETGDGGFIAAGYTIDPENLRNGLLIKTDVHGNATSGHGWQRSLNISDLDQLYSVQQTNDDGFVVAGFTAYGDAPTSMWLIKTDPLGNAPDTP